MDFTILFKLVLAAVLGGLIGTEREMAQKPAGLRTNILICVGSTLFMIVSVRTAEVFGGDPTRMSAQIISGIGFLGAGAIFHARGSVVGLTTAATIWLVAGVGMTLGAGFYGTALIATVLAIATLYLLGILTARLQARRQHYIYSLLVSAPGESTRIIDKVLEPLGIPLEDLSFKKEAGGYRIRFAASTSREASEKVMQALLENRQILEVEIEKEVS